LTTGPEFPQAALVINWPGKMGDVLSETSFSVAATLSISANLRVRLDFAGEDVEPGVGLATTGNLLLDPLTHVSTLEFAPSRIGKEIEVNPGAGLSSKERGVLQRLLTKEYGSKTSLQAIGVRSASPWAALRFVFVSLSIVGVALFSQVV